MDAAQKMMAADFKGWYVVPYEIIGSRMNGTKLVFAANAAQAKKAVRAKDDDFVCRYPATAFLTWCQEMDDDPYEERSRLTGIDYIGGDFAAVPLGSVFDIECGT